MIFKFGRRNKKCCGNKNCPARDNLFDSNTGNMQKTCRVTLEEAPEGKRLSVLANSDLKTMEMGLYPGAIISLIHNSMTEHNIIVAVHDQRYVFPKETAKNIIVRIRK